MFMRLKTLFEKTNCIGLIYKDKNGNYDYQNFNDMGFIFQDFQESKNQFIKFRKIKLNGKNWGALIKFKFECDYTYTLSECVKELLNCYDFEKSNI